MKRNHLLKILSSLIVKFSDVQDENFYFQVKYREIISFTKKMTLETGASLTNKKHEYREVVILDQCRDKSVARTLKKLRTTKGDYWVRN